MFSDVLHNFRTYRTSTCRNSDETTTLSVCLPIFFFFSASLLINQKKTNQHKHQYASPNHEPVNPMFTNYTKHHAKRIALRSLQRSKLAFHQYSNKTSSTTLASVEYKQPSLSGPSYTSTYFFDAIYAKQFSTVAIAKPTDLNIRNFSSLSPDAVKLIRAEFEVSTFYLSLLQILTLIHCAFAHTISHPISTQMIVCGRNP